NPRSSRDIAYDVLARWSELGGPATQELEQRLANASLSSAERGLAMELVHGVIRRRSTLDALLQQHVTRPIEKVEAGALTLLRMGVYQLFLLAGVPAYAVVNEATELARRIGKPQWTGFINGVLRSASRGVTDEFGEVPAMDALPLADGRYR